MVQVSNSFRFPADEFKLIEILFQNNQNQTCKFK